VPKKIKQTDENMIFRGATIDSEATIDEEERRVPIVISTEAPITMCEWNRRNYETDCYPQILIHSDESIVINREAIKLLHNHNSYALPIGRLENIRVEDSKLKADAIFSKANPDADVPWQMVQEGTLDEISVGGRIIEKSEVRDADDKIIQVDVTKWELLEASLVTIGADANAGVNRNLNTGENVNLEEIRREIQSIKAKLKAEKDESIQRALREEQSKLETEALKLENNELKRTIANDKRKEKILFIARKHNIGNDDESLQRFLSDENKTDKDFGLEILERMVEKQVHVGFQQDNNSDESITRAISDSLLIRAGYGLSEPHRDVKRFATATLLDIARMVTGMGDNYNRDDIVKRAMTTSQFPNLLLSTAQRVLEQSWDEVASTYQLWTQVEYFSDFRPKQYINRKSLLGTFDRVSEGGERKYVEFEENGRSWAIDSYGEKLLFTRKMLINDDLGALLGIIKDFIAKAKRTVNTHVYDILLEEGLYKNYKMGDKKPIFHTDHKNLSDTDAKLTETSLEELDTMMGEQIITNGKEQISLNIAPEFLIVGRKNRLTARKLLSSAASIDGKNAGIVNPFNNLYTLVEEQRLKDAFVLAAKTRTISVGFLAGNTEQMPIIEMTNKGLDGIEFNVELDFGVSATDYRRLAKNKGVA
jgi:HK97 family phage prohead protease